MEQNLAHRLCPGQSPGAQCGSQLPLPAAPGPHGSPPHGLSPATALSWFLLSASWGQCPHLSGSSPRPGVLLSFQIWAPHYRSELSYPSQAWHWAPLSLLPLLPLISPYYCLWSYITLKVFHFIAHTPYLGLPLSTITLPHTLLRPLFASSCLWESHCYFHISSAFVLI